MSSLEIKGEEKEIQIEWQHQNFTATALQFNFIPATIVWLHSATAFLSRQDKTSLSGKSVSEIKYENEFFFIQVFIFNLNFFY